MELYKSTEKNGGRKPYSTVADNMVKVLKDACPWISRQRINFTSSEYNASKEETFDVENLLEIQMP